MWRMMFTPAPEPNQDEELHKLLNLRPWVSEDRLLYNDDATMKVLHRNPGSTAVKYNFIVGGGHRGKKTSKMYPIFRIVSLGASLKTVKLCGRAYKEAFAQLADLNGGTVLHAACRYASADASVVRWVYRQHPDAVTVANKHRFSPLHIACAFGAPVEVVQLVLRWYPAALDAKNILGETPYMTAVNNGAPADVLEVLSNMNMPSSKRQRVVASILEPLQSILPALGMGMGMEVESSEKNDRRSSATATTVTTGTNSLSENCPSNSISKSN